MERTVKYMTAYVGYSNTNIYHMDKDCRGLNGIDPNPIQMKMSEVKNHTYRKYRPCHICAVKP